METAYRFNPDQPEWMQCIFEVWCRSRELDHKQRSEYQSAWRKGQIRLVVGTEALTKEAKKRNLID